MARAYPYDTSAQALYRPAENARFFEDWTDADTRNDRLLAAEMSRLAYAPRDIAETSLATIGFSIARWLGGERAAERAATRGTDGFVATSRDGTLIVVAFRGTEADKPEDLLADLFTQPSSWEGRGKVHTGFLRAYQPVRSAVAAALDARSSGALLITGHSLGAGVATLAAAEHAARQPTLITFGSPRVGDHAFAALFAGVTVHRVVGCCDVVTRIPPEQFDLDHVRPLLAELAPGLSIPLVVERALRTLLERFPISWQFEHVGQEVYADRHGRLGAAVDMGDQAQARSAYPGLIAGHRGGPEPVSWTALAALLAKPDLSLPQKLEQVVNVLLDGLRGDPVPMRDLADHTPLNYVSIFSGRV
jgi:hypothetical protein